MARSEEQARGVGVERHDLGDCFGSELEQFRNSQGAGVGLEAGE
ncbi:hypothetical protein ACFWIZ_42065 [Streptomyces sp. NPDC127044]